MNRVTSAKNKIKLASHMIKTKIVMMLCLLFTMLLLCGCDDRIDKLVNGTEDINLAEYVSKAEMATEDGGYGEPAYSYLEYINDNLANRTVSTEQEEKTASFIVAALMDMGFDRDDIEVAEFILPASTGKYSQNVILTLPGQSNEQIIVGAHYDSVETCGADDNGSGVSLLLENILRMSKQEHKYTIKYVFFGAHEYNDLSSYNLTFTTSKVNLGSFSYAWKSLMGDELDRTLLMINVDTILAGDYCYIYGGGVSWSELEETWPYKQAIKMAEELDLDIRSNPGTDETHPFPTASNYNGDQKYFAKKAIPYLYFEATNWELDKDSVIETEALGNVKHTEYDNLDTIEKAFGNRGKEHLKTYSILLECFLINVRGK